MPQFPKSDPLAHLVEIMPDGTPVEPTLPSEFVTDSWLANQLQMAVATVRSQRFNNAIVADINMPRMDGFELCHTVKADERLKSVPFIIVSSLSKEEEKRNQANHDRHLDQLLAERPDSTVDEFGSVISGDNLHALG